MVSDKRNNGASDNESDLFSVNSEIVQDIVLFFWRPDG